MLGFRCKKKQAPGRKLFCPARDPVSEPRGERPRPDLNTPDRRRGGSVQPEHNNGKGADGSYNSMTAGIKRFLSEPKSPAKQRNQFVNMLANCELPAAQRSRGRAKSRVVVKA